MEDKKLEISDELVKNLSVDEIAELKVEIDDLMNKLDNIIETCDEAMER